jgi:DNA adenine methylase
MTVQPLLPFDGFQPRSVRPFRTQLLKWVGNKQRFAHEIVSYFPEQFGTYFEPFLGSGAVLGTLSPKRAVASDIFKPLVEIWESLCRSPDELKRWYLERWQRISLSSKVAVYEKVRDNFNAAPNGADLLYLCRSCYGGVVRFRKADGFMSTPSGVHEPISPDSFSRRVDHWYARCRNVRFLLADYAYAMEQAERGDLVYCDPPYVDSQGILYGAQSFDLARLLAVIARCKERGVFVALSLDGTKKSGAKVCNVPIPNGLFEVEAAVNCGRSMLRRFQMGGRTLESEVVSDRLLLTYTPPGL